MPTQTSLVVAQGDTVRAGDHNKVVTDIAAIIAEVGAIATPTVTATYTGRKLTAVTTADDKFIINWNRTKVASIQYQKPVGTLVATYTPTYTGRNITAWAKS